MSCTAPPTNTTPLTTWISLKLSRALRMAVVFCPQESLFKSSNQTKVQQHLPKSKPLNYWTTSTWDAILWRVSLRRRGRNSRTQRCPLRTLPAGATCTESLRVETHTSSCLRKDKVQSLVTLLQMKAYMTLAWTTWIEESRTRSGRGLLTRWMVVSMPSQLSARPANLKWV